MIRKRAFGYIGVAVIAASCTAGPAVDNSLIWGRAVEEAAGKPTPSSWTTPGEWRFDLRGPENEDFGHVVFELTEEPVNPDTTCVGRSARLARMLESTTEIMPLETWYTEGVTHPAYEITGSTFVLTFNATICDANVELIGVLSEDGSEGWVLGQGLAAYEEIGTYSASRNPSGVSTRSAQQDSPMTSARVASSELLVVAGQLESIEYTKAGGGANLLGDTDVAYLSSCGTEWITLSDMEVLIGELPAGIRSFYALLGHSCSPTTGILMSRSRLVLGVERVDDAYAIRWNTVSSSPDRVTRYVMYAESIAKYFDDEFATPVYDDCEEGYEHYCIGIAVEDFVELFARTSTPAGTTESDMSE